MTPFRALLLLCFAGLLACAPRAPRQGWQSGAGIGELLALSQRSFEQLDGLTAEADISFRGPDGSGRATAAIIYRSPGELRLEVKDPLFRQVLSAAVRGDSMEVVAGGQTWRGTTSLGLLRYLPFLDLEGYDLRYLLFGIVAPWQPHEVPTLTHPRGDRAVATVSGDRGSRSVWADLHRGFVFREESVAAEGGTWRRDLERYREIPLPGEAAVPLYLPRLVRIVQPSATLEIEMRSYRVAFSAPP